MAKKKRSHTKKSPTRSKRQPGLSGVVRVYDSRAEVETDEGVFQLSSRSLREAMPGDRVYVSVHKGHGGQRRATVEHVIERALTSLVGTFEQAGPLGAVKPLDRRIKQDFFVLPQDDSPARIGATPGSMVVARMVSYPTRVESGVVILERCLGNQNTPSLGIECIMARYGYTNTYPQTALDEANKLTLNIEAAQADPLRRDIRTRTLITIDPADARDFDDAISVERTARGGWLLGVHIADVSAYVPWDSSIDLEARRRSTSVYLADRVLPMLPEHLCNNLCSLRPCEERLAFTVDIELDATGRVHAYEAYPSLIQSRARLAYEQADALLLGEDVAFASGMLSANLSIKQLHTLLQDAHELAQCRREIRRKRGSIDFDMPEIHAQLDEVGMPVALTTRKRTDATSLVEEAMLLANECVAEFLSDRDLLAAYRVHEQPSLDSLSATVKTLTELGLLEGGLAAGILLGEPRALAAAVDDAANTPASSLVNALLLRAQQRAIYKPLNEGHYALGARAYCHFTSPIRRYPDLMVHRVLKLALAKRELGKREAHARAEQLVGKGPQSLEHICPQLCRQASDAERAADAASLASQKVKVAQYYESRIGERDTGTVSWVSDLGAFVRLDATGAEGLIRMNALGGGWWNYDELRLSLTCESTGASIVPGARVVAEVLGVHVLRGHLDLKLIHVQKVHASAALK